ncbi:hypothetical protein VTN00DRAFT_5923 [Thermoascus crustaceus]|uniref:uncharacterized protein n=1 Tax=Thermoascus crustaceus TaxID=5088 RepID=UPI0037438E01
MRENESLEFHFYAQHAIQGILSRSHKTLLPSSSKWRNTPQNNNLHRVQAAKPRNTDASANDVKNADEAAQVALLKQFNRSQPVPWKI